MQKTYMQKSHITIILVFRLTFIRIKMWRTTDNADDNTDDSNDDNKDDDDSDGEDIIIDDKDWGKIFKK